MRLRLADDGITRLEARQKELYGRLAELRSTHAPPERRSAPRAPLLAAEPAPPVAVDGEQSVTSSEC